MNFHLCFSKTASLKERQLLIKHINYGQKNEIGEKSREIEGTTAELLACEETKLSHLLLPFFFARLSVFIYISDVYISIPPMQRGFLPPILSLPRGLICKIKTHTLLARAFTFLSLSLPLKQKPSAPRQRTPARKGYKVWTEPEKVALTAGVAKYGPGNFSFFCYFLLLEKGLLFAVFFKSFLFFFRSLFARREEGVCLFLSL